MFAFWLILVILIGITIFELIPRGVKARNAEKYGYGWPYELPPLNYFESAESPILSFWYDPVVSSDEGPQTTWGMSRESSSSDATNLDDVFGPDSYVRYNIEDIDGGRQAPPGPPE